MGLNTKSWVDRYRKAGLEPIPLHPGVKKPVATAWQTTPIDEQWTKAPDGANIGIRLGGGIGVVDTDDPKARQAMDIWLGLTGRTVTAVETPSGGAHFYIRLRGAPEELNWLLLNRLIGKGELRLRNAYVVAPGSTVDGKEYAFISGSPEDLKASSPIDYADIAWVLPALTKTKAGNQVGLPVRLPYRDLPSSALLILQWLGRAAAGDSYQDGSRKYDSRSDAEMAVVTILILSGWDFDQVEEAFVEYACGHYMEQGSRRSIYLSTTYDKSVGMLMSDPIRTEIVRLYQDVSKRIPAGDMEKAIQEAYLSLLAFAFKDASWVIRPSLRWLTDVSDLEPYRLTGALDALAKEKRIRQNHKTAKGDKRGMGMEFEILHKR